MTEVLLSAAIGMLGVAHIWQGAQVKRLERFVYGTGQGVRARRTCCRCRGQG